MRRILSKKKRNLDLPSIYKWLYYFNKDFVLCVVDELCRSHVQYGGHEKEPMSRVVYI